MAQELAKALILKNKPQLEAISTEVNGLHKEIIANAKATVISALAAGKLLVDMKELLPHGHFDKYVGEHTELSTRTARRYMELNEKWPLIEQELGPDAYVSTIDGCLKLVKPPKPKSATLADFPPTEVFHDKPGECGDNEADDDLGLDPGIREIAKELRERREERERGGTDGDGGSSDLGAGRPKKATAKTIEAELEKLYGQLTEKLEDYHALKPSNQHFDAQQALDTSYREFRIWKRE